MTAVESVRCLLGTRIAMAAFMTQENPTAKLIDILKSLDTLMLVTDARNGAFHGRPMAVADVTPSGELWFATSRDSEKVREVHAVGRGIVTGQKGREYVSVSGEVSTVDDRAKVRELWKDTWKVWFPEGKEDPQILLLRLKPESGEYWSNEGVAGIRYLFEAAKALITGERAEAPGPDQHAKVRM